MKKKPYLSTSGKIPQTQAENKEENWSFAAFSISDLQGWKISKTQLEKQGKIRIWVIGEKTSQYLEEQERKIRSQTIGQKTTSPEERQEKKTDVEWGKNKTIVSGVFRKREPLYQQFL